MINKLPENGTFSVSPLKYGLIFQSCYLSEIQFE